MIRNDIGKRVIGLGRQAQGTDHNGRKLRPGHIGVRVKQAVPLAINDPPRGQRLNSGLVCMGICAGDIRKGLARRNHRPGLYGGVLSCEAGASCLPALAGRDDLRIPHAVQAVLALLEPLGRHQPVEALLGGHLVGAGAVRRVQESAALEVEGHQIVQQGVPILDEAGIVQGDPQFAQGHDDLHAALGVGGTPGREASGRVLLFTHTGQSLVRRLFHRGLVLVLGQRLQRHAGDIWVGGVVAGGGRRRTAEQAPAAVRELTLQDPVNVHLAGGLRFGLWIFRHGIVPGIQGDERPDRAV